MYKVFSPKIVYWLKTLSKFVSVQLVVQALGFASGILLIRNLDKQEYAYLTLANSMQGTMNVLADSGIGSALSAIGGKVWQDPYRFGQLINTAMHIRRYLAAFTITIVTPILMWMLLKNGASLSYTVLLVIGILIELHFYLSDKIIVIVPRLYSQFNRLQSLDLIFASSRIILLLGAYISFINAAVAVFASTVASGLKNKFLWHWVKNTIELDSPTHEEDKKDIFKLIKLQAPACIFYCFQGQLTIILISIFGNTENIAEIGALGRLSVIFTLISSMAVNIFIPMFARCQTPNRLWERYWQIIGTYLVFAVCLFGFLLLFPDLFLSILGPQYSNLQKELILMIVQVIFYRLFVMMFSLNSSKGWIASPAILIPLSLLGQIISLLILDVSNVKGVILFNIFSTIPGFLLAFYLTYRGIRSLSLSNVEYKKS